ncbi:MAG: hypothetical protein ACHQLQ_01825 [Candidatus Acidiferrales bacterium]
MEAEELKKFIERGQEFIKTHPDYNAVLQRAAERGLNLTPEATREIVRLCRPDVPYALALEENESEARTVNVAPNEPANGERSADKIRRIASRLDRHDTFKTITEKPNEVATYLEKRKQDFLSGKRRRR